MAQIWPDLGQILMDPYALSNNINYILYYFEIIYMTAIISYSSGYNGLYMMMWQTPTNPYNFDNNSFLCHCIYGSVCSLSMKLSSWCWWNINHNLQSMVLRLTKSFVHYVPLICMHYVYTKLLRISDWQHDKTPLLWNMLCHQTQKYLCCLGMVPINFK